jgi:hypothetical protein
MYGGRLGPHEDSGDIEMCIKIARNSPKGVSDDNIHANLVNRGVNSGMAHLALVAAKILNKDVEDFLKGAE